MPEKKNIYIYLYFTTSFLITYAKHRVSTFTRIHGRAKTFTAWLSTNTLQRNYGETDDDDDDNRSLDILCRLAIHVMTVKREKKFQ